LRLSCDSSFNLRFHAEFECYCLRLNLKFNNWKIFKEMIEVNTEYKVRRINFKACFKAKFKTIVKC